MDKILKPEKRLEIIVRDNNTCQRCGKAVGEAGQIAHRIRQGKGSYNYINNYLIINHEKYLTKAYIENMIVDHRFNVVYTCGLECNASYNIFFRPLEMDELLKKILDDLNII